MNYRGAYYECRDGIAYVWRKISDHDSGQPPAWKITGSNPHVSIVDRARETIDREHDFGVSGSELIPTLPFSPDRLAPRRP